MADPSSIIGLIGVAAQFIQIGAQFGLDWKDAPKSVQAVMNELQSLIIVLSETNKKILNNPDVAAANGVVHLSVSELGLPAIQKELEDVLRDITSRAEAGRLGWRRFKEAFLARKTKEMVENLHRRCQVLNNLVAIDTAALTANIHRQGVDAAAEQRARETTAKEMEILDWLKRISVDFSVKQKDLIRRRQAETGQWFLNSKEYLEWLNSTDKNTLFCPGIPGAGKTILTAGVVEDLTARFLDDAAIAVAYIYCDYKRKDELGMEELLLSTLRQFCRQLQAPLPQAVKDLHRKCTAQDSQPRIDEISVALDDVLSIFTKVIIVVDALDECPHHAGLLSEIFCLQSKHAVKLYATSRFLDEITNRFTWSIMKEIRAIDEDINKYLRNRISVSGSSIVKAHADEVVTHIASAADGMFLLAQLHFDAIGTKKTLKKLRESLHNAPTAYDEAYQQAMDRIANQDSDSKELAYRTLSWIACAKRQLTISELLHALAVEVDDRSLDEDNIPHIEDILSSCTGLVTVDENGGIIRLVHYTTQEFLERTTQKRFPKAQYDIARSCLIYLSFDVFKDGPCPQEGNFEERLELNPLYDYAANNWGHHAREDPSLCPDVLSFLELEANREASVQALALSKRRKGYTDFSQRYARIGALHLASYFGVSEVIKSLATEGNINTADDYGRIPLLYAAEKGYTDAARELLNCGAKADLESSDFFYHNRALMHAIEEKHETVVRLLLEDNSRVKIAKRYRTTPLFMASSAGHDAVVKLLLENGADPNCGATPGLHSPLSIACNRGHETVVNLLLEHGANPNLRTYENANGPLIEAIHDGCYANVKLLLEKGADAEARDVNGDRPLTVAISKGNEAVVKLLVGNGATPPPPTEPMSPGGISTLNSAIWGGHVSIVQTLLEKNPKLALLKDNIGRMPLSLAAEIGRASITKILLAIDGVDPQAKDDYGLTALSIAAAHGHLKVAKTLLDTGSIDIEVLDRFGRNLLWWARRGCNQDIVQLILHEAEQKGIKLDDCYIPGKHGLPRVHDCTKASAVYICNVCTMHIAEADLSYRCTVCDNGDFDICEECYDDFGARCLGDGHSMQKSSLRGR